MSKFSPEQVEKLKEIGIYLRQRRLELSISLEQITSSTLIRVGLLKAIEEGQVDQLPEPVYLQGLIRHYGDALQIDGEALAKTFPQSDRSVASKTSPQGSSPGKVFWKLMRLEVYFLYILLLAGAVYGLFYFLKRSPVDKPEPLSTETSPPVVTSPPPTPTPSPAKTPTPKPQASEETAPLSATVSLEGRSWFRVQVDGKTEFEGILNEGTQKTWKAKKQLIIRVGNAGAVRLSKNQGSPQLLGSPGEVKEVTLISE